VSGIIEINRAFSYRGRNTYSSHENLVTPADVEMGVGEENPTSILSTQSNDVMVEDVEREALAEVLFQVRLKEVVSTLEEFPSVEKLNARQLGEVVLLIFGTKSIVGNGCYQYGSRTNRTSEELAVLASGDGGQDCRIESEHGEGEEAGPREQMAPGPWRLGEYILMPSSGTGYQQVVATLITSGVPPVRDHGIVSKFVSTLPR
jgi:hypothetical protein